MRATVLSFLLIALAACSAAPAVDSARAQPGVVAPSAPPQPPLDLACAGAFAQGGVVVCKTRPGARFSVDGKELGVADSGGWVVAGFDRDAGASAELAVSNRAERKAQTFAIAERAYSISRVNGLPQQTVTPTEPAVLERIKREGDLKTEATKSRADVEGFLENFAWPVQGVMSTPWGSRRILNGEPKQPHYGIDIAAPEGTQIRAPAGGVVVMANPDMFYDGGLVILDHGQGLFTYYLHMSRLDVVEGQRVARGDRVGAIGKKGRATGPHLCWRMRWRDRNLDPSLAVQALATARSELGNGAVLEAGAAPPNFTPWTPAATREAGK